MRKRFKEGDLSDEGQEVGGGITLPSISEHQFSKVEITRKKSQFLIRKALHEDALEFLFSDLKRVLGVSVLEQVVEFLVVYLEK